MNGIEINDELFNSAARAEYEIAMREIASSPHPLATSRVQRVAVRRPPSLPTLAATATGRCPTTGSAPPVAPNRTLS